MLQASGWLTARCQKMYGGCFISDGLCESYSSISMTACSSILAMGMMPLCLLIYTSVWTSADTIQIPYDSIGEHAHATALIGCHGFIDCKRLPCPVLRGLRSEDVIWDEGSLDQCGTLTGILPSFRNHPGGAAHPCDSGHVPQAQKTRAGPKDPQGDHFFLFMLTFDPFYNI